MFFILNNVCDEYLLNFKFTDKQYESMWHLFVKQVLVN